MNSRRLACIPATILLIGTLALAQLASAQSFAVIHTFEGGEDGANPYSGLVKDPAGNLYGTTSSGGGCDAGTVYEVNTAGQVIVLYDFCNPGDGASPTAGLVFDKQGNLYGENPFGGTYGYGTVFELTPHNDGSWTEAVLYNFATGTVGCWDSAGLVRDASGNLYGKIPCGGAHGYGAVYELDSTGQQTVLYDFMGGRDGAYPAASLIRDRAGNLYGTTTEGGRPQACKGKGCGVVFKLTRSITGWKESAIYRFAGGYHDGAVPLKIVFDTQGNLLGMTGAGGLRNCSTGSELGCGTFFALKRKPGGGWAESVLYRFQGRTGSDPSNLILDSTGKVYGTTYDGGADDKGVAFELKQSKTGWKEKVLYSFTGQMDGGNPTAGLVQDSAKNFYGATFGFGDTTCNPPNGCGVVFKITP